MEGAGANGVGAEGYALRGGVGGVAAPDAPGFARCPTVEGANLFFPEEMPS